MITHPLLASNAILQAVSAGSQRLRIGAGGDHIALVQIALTRLEFPAFDVPGSYSSGTKTALANFISRYCFYTAFADNSGETIDDEVINTIDKALSNTLGWRPASPPLVPGTRMQSANTCLPTTRIWVEQAIRGCALAERIVRGTQMIDLRDAEHTNLLAAYYLHFRLSLIKDSFLIPAFLPYNLQSVLIKVARVENVRHVLDILRKMQSKLRQSVDNIYREASEHPSVPAAPASCSFGGPRINLHPPFAGRSADSVSWITVHELVHMFVWSPHDAAHPYAFDPTYLTLSAERCLNNPDCYAHYVTQMAKKRPQMTPW